MVRSLIALVASVVVVHMFYVGIIRPEANLAIEAAKLIGQSSPRDLVVILKDYEQEICIILMFWSGYLIAEKLVSLVKDRYLFTVDLIYW
jgi:hypothetical protein